MTVLDTDVVEERLASVHQAVRRAMLDTIPDGEPHQWLYRATRSYPSRPGKALRPALCLAAAGAFGGPSADAMPAAVAIELLHNAFLVHDDIVDGSLRRRGRPTLSAEYGTALALNAGDALAVFSNRVLRHYAQGLESDLGDRLHSEFEVMALRTLEGQATELGWRRDDVRDLTPEHYLDLIMHKTCWYTSIHPLRVGALLGSQGRADLRPMVRFGFHLGAAFQIRDDLLNLEGDEQEYGKEIDGDLFEGKRTLPLIHLMSAATGPDQTTVDRYLRLDRSERTVDDVRQIRALLASYGSIDYTKAYAQGIADTAVEAFEVAFADATPGPDVEFIRALIPYMLGRRS
ncbi:MAG TPA: polyprenyl synthetase family protein [Aeromicrobium sp.]|nr:polyprenyl synthetase family protein [Aeromicrobium sp.]